ncbi:hypothetical protein GYMLUDRAFT_47016 [Collybiopsis luxurians FD-317 M1]|uniref:Uncharacterized protein n=1 Tax=Collybiopsis luxurians FD-317 M1 TaxID=944289 RepID=A0A0D0CEN6_9AGAR|nr:hypothetical protein GYMLUDRAFT_47016 [Collybiopsis luxurians FD-317 M1]
MASKGARNRAGGRGSTSSAAAGASSPKQPPNQYPTPSPLASPNPIPNFMSPPPPQPPKGRHHHSQSMDPRAGTSGGGSGTSSPNPGSERGGHNGTIPKYIYDFSKALAGEVRILLAEVGQLRDQRRQLQLEIAEIMALKSKHAQDGSSADYVGMGIGMPGGLPYDHPDLLAYAMAGLALPPPPDSSDPNLALTTVDPSAPPEPAPSGWRTVHKRGERKPRVKKGQTGLPTGPIPTPSQVPPLEVPRANVPAWAQWRPNPALSPTPHYQYPGSSATPPPRAGLFGPPSPPPK